MKHGVAFTYIWSHLSIRSRAARATSHTLQCSMSGRKVKKDKEINIVFKTKRF